MLTQIIFMGHTRPIKPVYNKKLEKNGYAFYGTKTKRIEAESVVLSSSFICHIQNILTLTLTHTHTSILLFIPMYYECINISD